MPNLIPFFAQWGLTALSLWVTSFIFDGIQFDGAAALIVAALVLGFANAIVKPILQNSNESFVVCLYLNSI